MITMAERHRVADKWYEVHAISDGISLIREIKSQRPETACLLISGCLDGDLVREAAKIVGVDHRVGSIEIGKDADFAIVDGDILHYMTMVRWTVVNGRVVYDKQKDSLLDHIRPDGDRDAPAPSEYWPRRLGQEQ